MTESPDMNKKTTGTRKYWKVAGIVLGVAGVLALAAGARWFFTCPCDFTPGSVLWGELVEEPVDDWLFANDVELCQIQVQAGFLPPHAVNLNCMSTSQGNLYLSCSQCEPKRWSRLARRNESARIRLDGMVYPVRLTRVTDPGEADLAWRVRLEKLSNLNGPGAGTPVDTPRPSDEQWWTFRVESAVN